MPLNSIYIYELAKKFNLSPAAIAYIEARRSGEPSRKVNNSRTSNVSGTFYSDKTDLSIDTESRGPERGFAVLCEFDERVDEFYTQLQPVKLAIINKAGKKQSIWYTADFLVLGDYKPKVFEIKSLSDAEKLVKTRPNDWVKGDDGSFRYLPAERAFNKLGLDFYVWVYKEEDRFRIENYYIILAARPYYRVNLQSAEIVATLFKKKFCMSIVEAMEQLGFLSTTPIIQLIDEGGIRADINDALLSNPEGCLIAQDQSLLEHGKIIWNSMKIYQGDNIDAAQLNEIPKQNAAETALKKLKHLETGINDKANRRARALIQNPQNLGLSNFQRLLPKWSNSGNYGSKVPKVVLNYLIYYLNEIHSQLQGASETKSYAKYRMLAKQEHPNLGPVSDRTFRRWRKKYRTVEALGRGGQRAKNAVQAATDPLTRNIKAMVPWQAAAIDHYQASLYLVYFSHDNRVWVEKPWITTLIDIATSEILAYSVSFLSPSRRAIAKCMRDCVRRHGRLPMEIASDHGSDFMSVYMASFLAHYGINHSLRPSAYPQFGADVEGPFGEFEKDFLCMRPGNTVNKAEARTSDGNKTPKNAAILTLEEFKTEMDLYIQWRSGKIRGDATESVSYKFNRGVRLFPFMGKEVEYNRNFLMMSAVDVRPFTIHPSKGIHIDERWYYSTELQTLLGKTNKIPVRIEPENPFVVYALVNDNWVPCYNSAINTFEASSPESQFAQGVIKIEGRLLRAKARAEDDDALMSMIHTLPTDRQLPAVSSPTGNVLQNNDDNALFDLTTIKPLSSTGWGASE